MYVYVLFLFDKGIQLEDQLYEVKPYTDDYRNGTFHLTLFCYIRH